jgi:hypothetical protein
MITEFDKTRNKVIRRWVNVSPGRADEIADLVVKETAALRRQVDELARLAEQLWWCAVSLCPYCNGPDNYCDEHEQARAALPHARSGDKK